MYEEDRDGISAMTRWREIYLPTTNWETCNDPKRPGTLEITGTCRDDIEIGCEMEQDDCDGGQMGP